MKYRLFTLFISCLLVKILSAQASNDKLGLLLITNSDYAGMIEKNKTLLKLDPLHYVDDGRDKMKRLFPNAVWRDIRNFPDKQTFLSKFVPALDSFKRAGVSKLIIYYSGHGSVIEPDQEVFLIPTGFEILRNQNLTESYELNDLLKKMIEKGGRNSDEKGFLAKMKKNSLWNDAVPLSIILRNKEIETFQTVFVYDACRNNIIPDVPRDMQVSAGFVGDLLPEVRKNADRKRIAEAFNNFDRTLSNTFSSLNAEANRFYSNIGISNSKRAQSLGIIFSSAYGYSSYENQEVGSVFTHFFDKRIRSTTSRTLVFDRNLITAINQEMGSYGSKGQKGSLVGDDAFSIPNPYFVDDTIQKRSEQLMVYSPGSFIKLRQKFRSEFDGDFTIPWYMPVMSPEKVVLRIDTIDWFRIRQFNFETARGTTTRLCYNNGDNCQAAIPLNYQADFTVKFDLTNLEDPVSATGPQFLDWFFVGDPVKPGETSADTLIYRMGIAINNGIYKLSFTFRNGIGIQSKYTVLFSTILESPEEKNFFLGNDFAKITIRKYKNGDDNSFYFFLNERFLGKADDPAGDSPLKSKVPAIFIFNYVPPKTRIDETGTSTLYRNQFSFGNKIVIKEIRLSEVVSN